VTKKLSSALLVVALCTLTAQAQVKNAEDCNTQKDFAKRVVSCTQALAAKITDAQRALFLDRRGFALYRTQKWNEALEDYNLSIQLDPTSFGVFYNRALLFYARQEYRKAANDWNVSLDLLEAELATKPDADLSRFAENTRGRSENAERRAALEEHWIAYLDHIQKSNDHRNWKGPPHDLYISGEARRLNPP
jgi:tetratricopeptide (TPR) repeat protein